MQRAVEGCYLKSRKQAHGRGRRLAQCLELNDSQLTVSFLSANSGSLDSASNKEQSQARLFGSVCRAIERSKISVPIRRASILEVRWTGTITTPTYGDDLLAVAFRAAHIRLSSFRALMINGTPTGPSNGR